MVPLLPPHLSGRGSRPLTSSEKQQHQMTKMLAVFISVFHHYFCVFYAYLVLFFLFFIISPLSQSMLRVYAAFSTDFGVGGGFKRASLSGSPYGIKKRDAGSNGIDGTDFYVALTLKYDFNSIFYPPCIILPQYGTAQLLHKLE